MTAIDSNASTTGEEGWLTDRRRALLRYAGLYPALTVAPLVGLALVRPVYGVPGLGLVAMVAGMYAGVFGDDLRSESMVSSAYVSPGGPEHHVSPDSSLSSERLIAYATGVGFIAFLAFVLTARAAF